MLRSETTPSQVPRDPFKLSKTRLVPGCRSGYKATKKNPIVVKKKIFSFLKDQDLRARLLQFIKREHWTPTSNTGICEMHFTKDSIIDNVITDYQELKTGSVPRSVTFPTGD